MPYYPEWRIYPRYRERIGLTEKLGDILIHRAWHYSRPAPGVFGRLAHEASLCIFSIPQILRAIDGADIVYIVSPDLSLAFVASVLSRVMGKRRALIVQDVQPEAAVDLGMLRNKRLVRVAEWMARSIYESSHEIYTLSEGMRRRVAPRTSNPEKIALMPNTIDVVELAPVEGTESRFRQTFVKGDTFAVVHAGNMGQKQDLDLILRTAQRIKHNSRIHFYVFGDGAVKDEFLRKRDEANLTNVSHFPFQDRGMLPHMLREADAVIVSQLPEVVDVVVPSKLMTAMGAGAMIIAACAGSSETTKIMRESGGGIVIPASDDSALSETLEALSTGSIDAASCRKAARAYAVAHFDRNAVYRPRLTSLRHPRQQHEL
jgi:colanic acid biosynthesis glycosyl transferase WcaI